MEKVRYIYNEEVTMTVNIKEVLNNNLVGFADFLKYIKKENPDSINAYIEEIISQCDTEVDYGISIDNDDEIFQKNSLLLNKSINKILSLMKYSKYQKEPIDTKITVNVVDLVKTYTGFDYIQAISLLRIFPKQEAIDFMKEYISQYIKSRNNPDKYYNNLKDLLEYFKNTNKIWQTHDGTLMMVNGNKMILKVNKCRWAEELLNQGFDQELCFSMMCYQDLVSVKNYNPNFTLTRTKTLMQGGEYCDFCYHDVDKDSDTTHPPTEFWNGID
ncbi:MAG: L-2-amino-thiazoline-4-carboxylic acid hydrolase [Candidatus Hermodarchaeota archaeon]